MKIANTADWHFRGRDLAHARAQGLAMAEECVRRGVGLVTVAGDVFDRPTIGDQHASTGAIAGAAIEVVKRLTDAGIDVLMIHGNHDQSGPGSADALHVFDGMEGVTIIREPAYHVIGMLNEAHKIKILCLPWSWGADGAEAAILQVMQSHVHTDLLLAHVEVVGSRMQGTRCCEPSPGKWQVSRQFLESLPVDHIALGHFHARQDLTGRGGYIGALRQCNFGEEGNAAGFEVWDSETGLTEWVELDAAPRYKSYAMTNDALVIPDASPQEIARVIFDGETPDPVLVRDLENSGVRVEQIIDRQERIQRAEVPQGILADRHAMMRLYGASQHPPIEGERLERMLRVHDGLFADKPTVTISGDVPVSEMKPETRDALTRMAGAASKAMREDQLPF